jgi:antitoxin VapB
MSARGLGAVVLTQKINFQWLTAGADNHVVIDTDGGVAPIVITAEGQYIVTNNIEAVRLEDEEIGELPFEIHFMNWHDENRAGMLAQMVEGRVASAGPWPADAEVTDRPLARLRWSLLEPEIERYRELGRITVQALGEVAREIEPGMTEHEIGAKLAAKLIAQNIIVSVLLIAVDERMSKYRHPIPTDKRLEKQAMLVVGARKWGLDISATRLVHFGKLPAELAEKHRAVCQIDATFISETRPGEGIAAYEASGYRDEWKLHHQGGATGYAPRDYKGTMQCPETVLENQVFAWNPSITGTKSEDTIIAMADQTEVLSADEQWPMVEVEYAGDKMTRPDILVR